MLIYSYVETHDDNDDEADTNRYLHLVRIQEMSSIKHNIYYSPILTDIPQQVLAIKEGRVTVYNTWKLRQLQFTQTLNSQ